MLAELAAITSVLSTINAAVSQARESKASIEDVGNLIARFSTQSSKLDNLERKTKLKKPLTPAQSAKLVLARRASAQAMRDLKDLCLMAGAGDVWRDTEKAMREADRQQKEFLRDIAVKRRKRKNKIQGITIALFLVLSTIAIIGGSYVVYDGYKQAQYEKKKTRLDSRREELRNIRQCGRKQC